MPPRSLALLRLLLPGLAVAAGLAVTANLLAGLPALKALGLSPLPLAIVAGSGAAHSVFPRVSGAAGPGVEFCKSRLLRLGIVLYGFRISFQQIASVGMRGVLIDALMVGLTFGAAVLIGTRLLKLDRHTAMLVGAGSAICGAAAILATEPLMRCPAHKVTVAVATVVVFGTLGMFLYPALFTHLALSPLQFGIYVGSTLHEVAQVVATGEALGPAAANAAVIEKMLRVMMLAPFLLALAAGLGNAHGGARARRVVIPWFALLFIAASAVGSWVKIPDAWATLISEVDLFVLAMAMASLGLRTHVSALRQAGPKPMLLAALLFVFLTVGGLAVNLAVIRLL